MSHARSCHARLIQIMAQGSLLLAFCLSIGFKVEAASPPGLEKRRETLLSMSDPKLMSGKSVKLLPYDIVAATALKGCGSADWPAFMASLGSTKLNPREEQPVEMFSLPPLVRYLYQFGDCMSDEQKDQLLDDLTSRRQRLLAHGTINHAAMQATSWYLLAQYFPKAKWRDWDGKTFYTSGELMDKLKTRLLNRVFGLYRDGHTEWLSPTYAIVNIGPMLNLYDFAKDRDVKKLGEQEVTLEVAVLRASSFHGQLVPPLTRKNFDQRNASERTTNYVPSVAQHALWYYFGEPSGFELYEFRSRKEPFFVIMLALSDWVPPKELFDIDSYQTRGYEIYINTPGFSQWGAPVIPYVFGSAYISDPLAVASGNARFDPDGYSDHVQTFSITLKSEKPLNEIECYQPYFNSNLGEDAWSTDRWSPFQQTFRYDKTSVVMLIDIPKMDPWPVRPDNQYFAKRVQHKDALLQVITCRLPTEFDEIVHEDNWVFAREGSSYAALNVLNGEFIEDKGKRQDGGRYRLFKVREPKTALFFRAETGGAGLSFEEFHKAVMRKAPTYSLKSSSIKIKTSEGQATEMKFAVRSDDQGPAVLSAPTLRSGSTAKSLGASEAPITAPFMTLQGGVLTVKGLNSVLQIKPAPPPKIIP